LRGFTAATSSATAEGQSVRIGAGSSSVVFSDPFFWRTEEGKRLDEYDGGIRQWALPVLSAAALAPAAILIAVPAAEAEAVSVGDVYWL
jgi:hypothetical protein